MTVQSADNVLSTLRKDGSRRWINPRLSHGRYLHARRAVAYALILIFLGLPFLRINGKPAVLLDIVHRRFTLFGYTFLPTDTILLALLMLFVFVSIFLFTAVLGRLWCGWACPQTIYMEFLYRPLERLFDGTVGKGGQGHIQSPWRKIGYFVAALLVTAIPAHTFLAYFVGVEQLSHWMRQSPLQHPTAFLVMAVTLFLMMFDFYWFREQLCLIACPYGRFQSVLLDKSSLIVSYDRRRGEPRGKLGRNLSLPLAAGEAVARGDCVDCGMCVTTCPTGIDIRNGLQMECINCTQCIDACDAVMDRIHKPRGLIRYSSQSAMEGEKGPRVRFRLIFYPVILCVLATLWLLIFSNKSSADVTLLRDFGSPFTTLASGRIAVPVRLKITNRLDAGVQYTMALKDASDGRLDAPENPVSIPGNGAKSVAFVIELPASAFHHGECTVTLQIEGSNGFSKAVPLHLLGPFHLTEEPEHEHE